MNEFITDILKFILKLFLIVLIALFIYSIVCSAYLCLTFYDNVINEIKYFFLNYNYNFKYY